MMETRPLRLGIVPYLNVLPLIEGLEQRFPADNWVRATPRELAGLLANGEVDVATLPVFEALRNGGGPMLLSGAAIACDGPVRSVRLFSRVPFQDIRRLLLDRSSLTSVHLARLLCAQHLRIAPEYITSETPLGRDFDPAEAGCDAAVVIGDAALDREGTMPYELDFGAAWKELTGLPFVFAAWIVRPGAAITPDDAQAFAAARERGEASASEIAAREAHLHPRGAADLTRYLTEAIRFRLGERELEGIERFRRELISQGLIPSNSQPLSLHPSAAAALRAAIQTS
ncbi:MAG: menaquinone biosynthesis protein [Sumerlaeia bacterium]